MTCWNKIPPIGNVDQYIRAINNFPFLTPEEEAEITAPLSEENKNILILSHLRQAHSIARDYFNSGIAIDELIQIANEGLLLAVKKFDHERGRFNTLAQFYIRSALNEYLMANSRMVRSTKTKPQKKLFWHIGREVADRRTLTGRTSLNTRDMQEIAEKLNVNVDEVREASIRYTASDVSLNAILDEDSENSRVFTDAEADPVKVLERAQRDWIASVGLSDALEILDDRSRFIIETRFMTEHTLGLHELAAIFDISAERIRQIEGKALKQLREHLSEYA